VRISKTILVVLVATLVVAAFPNASYPWTTVFEVRASSGVTPREYTLQSIIYGRFVVCVLLPFKSHVPFIGALELTVGHVNSAFAMPNPIAVKRYLVYASSPMGTVRRKK
jgi:hypothetical protein